MLLVYKNKYMYLAQKLHFFGSNYTSKFENYFCASY